MTQSLTTPALNVHKLSKKYGDFHALLPVSFSLFPGQIAILGGPNGSGKTTLLNCISGLILPTKDSVHVCGFDMDTHEIEVRRRLAYVPDVPRFYLELTAWEHLRFIAAANDCLADFEVKAETLLRQFGLWEARETFPHHFSRGMRLKLGLLMGLIRPSAVLLLDEPTSAMDEEGVALLEAELKTRKAQGAAILLSSHDSAFTARLADRVFRIEQGSFSEISR